MKKSIPDSKAAVEERFTLAFTGDMMLGRWVNDVIQSKGPSYTMPIR